MAYDDFFNALGQGVGLYQNVAGAQANQQGANQVQQSLGQNAGALQEQIAALQAQLGQGGQAAQAAYDQANALFGSQNQGLQGNIDTQTANLQALSDPNSPYMKMARQAMERKDAAAGRRSQWGERETQLAALLAEQVGKYSPGIQQSITGARNQMATNQQTLAQLYAQMQNANTQRQQSLNQALQAQQQAAAQQAGIGRSTQQGAANSNAAALQNALGLGKSLYGMFGGGGSGGNAILSGGDQDLSFMGGGQDYSPWVSTYGGFGDAGFNDSLSNQTFLGAGGNLFGDYGGGSTFGGGGDLFSNDYWDF